MQSRPGGVPANPAQRAVPDFPSYTVPNGVQAPYEAREAEQRLVAAGWTWPSQLACDCVRFGLHASDFRDRLCGVTVGFLRACGEDGRTPTLAGAEAVLTAFGVPRDPDELYFVLQVTIVPRGCEFADLIGDVLGGSEKRSAQQLRELTTDALRAVNHTFNCPRCSACANGATPTVKRHGTVWETPSSVGKAVRYA